MIFEIIKVINTIIVGKIICIIKKEKESNYWTSYFLTLTVTFLINLPKLAWYLIFLPTLSFLRIFFLIVTFAIPFLLVFAVYFLPLNLKVIFLFLSGVLPCFRVAVKTSFLADFLTATFLRVNVFFATDLAGGAGDWFYIYSVRSWIIYVSIIYLDFNFMSTNT